MKILGYLVYIIMTGLAVAAYHYGQEDLKKVRIETKKAVSELKHKRDLALIALEEDLAVVKKEFDETRVITEGLEAKEKTALEVRAAQDKAFAEITGQVAALNKSRADAANEKVKYQEKIKVTETVIPIVHRDIIRLKPYPKTVIPKKPE